MRQEARGMRHEAGGIAQISALARCATEKARAKEGIEGGDWALAWPHAWEGGDWAHAWPHAWPKEGIGL